ncbi:MAG: orotate phosphoribosyltransferase [Actinobacteria bacterium]|nr:orotate phosphoribosyltransferase [Actinomycetota bacterium]
MTLTITERNRLAQDIKSAAFLTGDFTTRAGKKTSYYIDKYKFTTRPEIMGPLAKAIQDHLPDLAFDRIAAPELGAVPIAAVLSVQIERPFVIVRKASKGYGTENLIEGSYKKGDKMVLVEDVLTTGGAAMAAAEVLEANGVEVLKIIGVVNREEGAHEAIQNRGWAVSSILTASELKALD